MVSKKQLKGGKMTIDEAIRIKEACLRGENVENPLTLRRAERLSIEALKRLKEHREEHIDITFRALLGETKE